MGRSSYMADLRAAIAKAVPGRTLISLATLESALPDHFAHELPSRVTLAKAITGLGWVKISHPGPGAVYQRPSQPARRRIPPPARPDLQAPETAHDR